MKCPEATQPHATECNKYLKCVQTTNIATWITMECQEGLIYDKNLRSCAIPGEDWECMTDMDEDAGVQDDRNVYGIDNLEVSRNEQDESAEVEFLEVIDEDLNLPQSRSDNSFEEHSSGDGELREISVTPASPTVRMITTQLQRLTQLMQHVNDKENGVVDDDVTADDLNSFLATQKIQSDSEDYQKINFHSKDKTPMPSSGRIHPEILNEVLEEQSQLTSDKVRLTTLAMDETTQKTPIFYADREPMTEIKLNSGQSSDGLGGAHQIVVNRPEGSVLFNVPQPNENKQQSPYLSEDILKAILEISKHMVTTSHEKQSPQASYAPQPFYYAVPVPYLSPQATNGNGYFNHDYRNNLTDVPAKKKTKPSKVQLTQVKKAPPKADEGFADSFGYYQPSKPQTYPTQSDHQKYQNPNFYYQNYPSYSNGYQSYQQQFPAYQNQYNDYNQQQFNYDGSYYGNRPFVMQSSAPSYVEQKPFGKESYATSYDGDDDVEDEGGDDLYDEVEQDEPPVTQPPKTELICSYVVQRQANLTDCTRYYVCNSKTKEVLSYTCPAFTAFNDLVKFCDPASYPACKKIKDREKSSAQNQRIYDQANAALEQVKKETQKVERIASMVRHQTKKIYNRRDQYQPSYQEPAPVYYPPTYAHVQKVRKPLIRKQAVSKPKPTRKAAKKKKKRVKCHDIGNIADPESSSSYWHCFRGNDGRMKRINRKCSQTFIFCPSTNFCTSSNRCVN